VNYAQAVSKRATARLIVRCVVGGLVLLGTFSLVYGLAYAAMAGALDDLIRQPLPALRAELAMIASLWLPAAALVVLEPRLVRWLAPIPDAACPRCGYALEALKGDTCPECGFTLRSDGPPPRNTPRDGD